MFGINYNGLKKRQTYDELVNYIETDPNKIKYPNRSATFAERSHYMKHLGGEDYLDMEEQQLRASKQKLKEEMLRSRSYVDEGPGYGTLSLSRFMSGRSIPPGGPSFYNIGTQEEQPRRLIGEDGSEISSVIEVYGNEPRGRELREDVQRNLEDQQRKIQEKLERIRMRANEFNAGVEYVPGILHQEQEETDVQPGTAEQEEVEPQPEQAMQGYREIMESSILSDKNLKISEVYEEYPKEWEAYEIIIDDINGQTDQPIDMKLLRTQKITENELIAIHYYAMRVKASGEKKNLQGIIDHVRRTPEETIKLVIERYGKKVAQSTGASSSAAASSAAPASTVVALSKTKQDELDDEEIENLYQKYKGDKKYILEFVKDHLGPGETQIETYDPKYKLGKKSINNATVKELITFTVKHGLTIPDKKKVIVNL